MATQRFTVAAIAGKAGAAVAALCRAWSLAQFDGQLSTLVRLLRTNGAALPVVYFCEWIDRWLMGDALPEPVARDQNLEVTWGSAGEASTWATQCGRQFPEELWLAARLGEAAQSAPPNSECVVLLVREVLGATPTDDEVMVACQTVPAWLSADLFPGKRRVE